VHRATSREQEFKLPQVVELGPDVFEMMRRDLADLATRRFVGSPAGSSADFSKRKSQLAATVDEARMRRCEGS